MCVRCVIVGRFPPARWQFGYLEEGRVWSCSVSITHRGYFDVGPLQGGRVLYEEEGGEEGAAGGQVRTGERILRSQEKY